MAYSKERAKYYQMVSFELTKSFNEKVNEFCKENDMSKSELFRAAIRQYLEEHEN